MPAFLRFGILLSLVAGTGPSVQAETPQAGAGAGGEHVVQIDELVAELLKSNPAIHAALHRVDAAAKRPSQMSTLPEPKFSVTNFGVGHPVSRLRDSDFAYYGFGFSQEIPFPGKLALAGEEAKREAESERQMYRNLVLNLVAQLRVAYYEWFGVIKSIEITRKSRDLLQRFEQIARVRYSVGKGLQQDVLRAQVEESTLAQQLEVLAQRKGTLEARIRLLVNSERALGRPAELRLTPIVTGLETLLMAAGRDAPRLKARQAMVDSRAVGIERAQKEYRPDFGVSFQWQKNGSPFRDYYMATAEVKVPLYFWRKQRLSVEESASRLREARFDFQAERQELIFEVKDLYLTAKTSERLVALYQSGIIPQSALSLESALAGYEVGGVDFLTLMNNFMTVLTYEMKYYEELAKHAQAVARLEALVASPLGELEQQR